MTDTKSSEQPPVVVIGGGPAGLMAAEVLVQGGAKVDLYEAMPGMGRKFLVAGKGGLNITHAEPFAEFLTRYGARRSNLESYLRDFGPTELRVWLHELGFETFEGTSGKVFPRVMKAGPILHAWLERLVKNGITLHTRHRWLGWDQENQLLFISPQGKKVVSANTVVLALGGGSWPMLGSNGAWVEMLKERDIPIAPLKPANCGFNVRWSDYFRERFSGQPLKAVELAFKDFQGRYFKQRGEFIITIHGVEGNLIYAVAAWIRDEIEARGQAIIHLDLSPDRSHQVLTSQLSKQRGSRSISEHLRRAAGIQGVKAGLLWEFLPKESFLDPAMLADAIKALPIPLISPRPLKEAISTAGGVIFEALDKNLMIRSLPGIFCAGEMLDWEAPTGGYLLTACFSTGYSAGLGVLKWLKR